MTWQEAYILINPADACKYAAPRGVGRLCVSR